MIGAAQNKTAYVLGMAHYFLRTRQNKLPARIRFNSLEDLPEDHPSKMNPAPSPIMGMEKEEWNGMIRKVLEGNFRNDHRGFAPMTPRSGLRGPFGPRGIFSIVLVRRLLFLLGGVLAVHECTRGRWLRLRQSSDGARTRSRKLLLDRACESLVFLRKLYWKTML